MDSTWVLVSLDYMLKTNLKKNLLKVLNLHSACTQVVLAVTPPCWVLLPGCAAPASGLLLCCRRCRGTCSQDSDACCYGAEEQCVGLLLCCMKEDLDHDTTACRSRARLCLTKKKKKRVECLSCFNISARACSHQPFKPMSVED